MNRLTSSHLQHERVTVATEEQRAAEGETLTSHTESLNTFTGRETFKCLNQTFIQMFVEEYNQ